MKCFICTIIMAIFFPFCAYSQSEKKYLIYEVNSYNHETFEWTKEEHAGFVKGLAEKGLVQGQHYNIVSDTMDSLAKASQMEMKKQAARILKNIKAKKPDLILTTDDDALKWVGLQLDKIPIIFNGVNGRPDVYLSSDKLNSIEKPGHNITGVYQTTYFKQSLDFIKQLYPDSKTFAAITDESTTSSALLADLNQQKNLPLILKEVLHSKKFSEWKKKINTWQKEVDCLFVLGNNTVEDDAGEIISPEAVVQWIFENSTLPNTCPWAYQVKDGILVSAADSALEQGRYAAFFAADILLKGVNPGSLPIITPPNGIPALNGKHAEKLKLNMPSEFLEIFINAGKIF